MSQTIKLKRSSLAGKVPTTGNLDLGEIALNTNDGKVFFKKNDGTDSIQTILTTDAEITGNLYLSGSLTASEALIGPLTFPTTDGSAGQFLKTDGAGNIGFVDGVSFPYTGSAIISSSLQVTGSSSVTGSFSLNNYSLPETDGEDGQVIMTDGAGGLVFNDVVKYVTVKNIETVTLQKGTPVHATSSVGNTVEVVAASASLARTMPATFVLNETLDPDQEGRAILTGFINGVNTSGFNEGDVVYVGESSGYTNVKPTGTNLIQNLGIVSKTHPSNGSGYIYGSGRSNATPNLLNGEVFFGEGNVSIQKPLSDILSGSSYVYSGSFSGSFEGDGSGLTGVGGIFSVSGSDIENNQFNSEVSVLQFDSSTGLNVSQSAVGTALVSIGSHYRDIIINGQTTLVATGSDQLELIAGDGIDLTTSTSDTNANSVSKEINFSVDNTVLRTTGDSVVSSSSQIDHDQTTNFSSDEHFTQANITTVGTVTSGDITGILPSGTVSSSAQLESTFDTRYLNTTGDSVVSSSTQIATEISGAFVEPSSSFSTRVSQNESDISDLQTDSGSFSTRVSTNENDISTNQTDISNLQTDSGSFSTRVSDNETDISNLQTDSGSFSTRVTTNETDISNLQTDSGSFSTRITTNESDISTLQSITFLSSSAEGDGQGQIKLNGVNVNTNGLGTDDSPQFTNLTLSGDLTVNGTTTTVNSTEVEIGDRIIVLNGQDAAGDSGINVYDTSTNQTGSLLWDSSGDYWKAGELGSEVKILRQTGDSVVSSSTQIDHDQTTNFVSNEHIDHSGVSITAGNGLTGGGNITTSRTLNVGAGDGITVNANDIQVDGTVLRTTGDSVVSSSAQIDHDSTTNYSADEHFTQANITTVGTVTAGNVDAILPSGTVSSSAQLTNTFLEITGDSVVSSSAQIDHDQTTNFSADEHFTQANITTVGTVTSGDITGILPSGTVSGSSQINADSITNFDTNVKDKMNTDGVISSSAQIDHDSTTNYSADEHFTQGDITTVGTVTSGDITGILPSGVVSGSSQLTNTFLEIIGDSVVSSSAQIDHDQTTNFVSNEHIDHSGVSITAGSGLTGGGNITTSRTLNVGAGDGISVSADAVAVDSTVVRTSGDQTIGGLKIFSSNISSSGDFTIRKNEPTIRLVDDNATTTNFPRIILDTNNNQGVMLYHDEFDTFLPESGYGLVLGPSPNNTQFPSTGDLTFQVLGNIYADTETTGSGYKVLTTNDGLSKVGDSVVSSSAQISHDSTSGFVSNEHIDHSGVSITAGSGLTGGGNITTSRTLNIGAGDGITVNADDIQVDGTVLRTTGDSVVSSSAQIDHDQTTNFSSDEHFTQGNITTVGTVTSGDVSAILPSGVVSGSSQLTNTFLEIIGDSVISSSAEGDGQGQIKLNGVNVNTNGLGTDDSPQFTNLTLSGDLTVNGTTTTVNSTEVEIGDRIIVLNGQNAAGDSGINVYDNATNQTGSLLWDTTSDYWKGGLLGSEARFLTVDDEGSGNGLDADTVDSLEASQFLRSDASDTATGNIRIENANNIPLMVTGSHATYTSILVGNSGTGAATLWLDGSNGDLVGGDYAAVRQTNDKHLQLEVSSNGGDIIFTESGAETMRLKDGNVGIGTTSPTAGLVVSRSMDAAFIAAFENQSNSGHGLIIQAGGTSGTRYITQWKDAAGTERFHMDDTGETYFQNSVGIGTSSPSANLDIVGGGGSTSPTLELNSSTSTTFNHVINAFNSNLTSGENQIIVVGKEGSTKNSGYIGYKWSGSASNLNVLTFGHWGNDNLMNLTADGKLGIGTTGPSTKLHLYESGASDVIFRITPANASYDSLIQLTGQDNDITVEGFEIWYDNNVGDVHLSTTYADDAAAIRFHTRTGASKSTSNERMTINGNGNVGIGNSSPSQPLTVAGNISGSGNLDVEGYVQFGEGLLSFTENTDVDTGTEVISSLSTSVYEGAFFDVIIKNGTNVRGSQVMIVHDGTSAVMSETSTTDLGDTSDLTLEADVSGGTFRLKATATSDNWSVRTVTRAF